MDTNVIVQEVSEVLQSIIRYGGKKTFTVKIKDRSGRVRYRKAFYEGCVQRVIDEVLKEFSAPQQPITIEDIKSRNRKRNIAEARQVIMYILYKKFNMKCVQAGKFINRDHSTVIYSSDEVQARMSLYPEFRDKIYKIMKKIKPDYQVEVEC